MFSRDLKPALLISVMPRPFPTEQNPVDREVAIEQALAGTWLPHQDLERGKRVLEAHFDELFAADGETIAPLWRPEGRDIFITWETN